jgi:hypothetical protein
MLSVMRVGSIRTRFLAHEIGVIVRANTDLRAFCESFGAANDRLLIRMRGRIGKAFKGGARIPFLKTIHALATQSRYTLVPCEKHSLSDILKCGVACHRFSHPRRDIRNRITDCFDDFDLCFGGNAKRCGDELSETLTRTPAVTMTLCAARFNSRSKAARS